MDMEDMEQLQHVVLCFHHQLGVAPKAKHSKSPSVANLR
jgi:hypothetical protein